jgi:hypothetical protein
VNVLDDINYRELTKNDPPAKIRPVKWGAMKGSGVDDDPVIGIPPTIQRTPTTGREQAGLDPNSGPYNPRPGDSLGGGLVVAYRHTHSDAGLVIVALPRTMSTVHPFVVWRFDECGGSTYSGSYVFTIEEALDDLRSRLPRLTNQLPA